MGAAPDLYVAESEKIGSVSESAAQHESMPVDTNVPGITRPLPMGEADLNSVCEDLCNNGNKGDCSGEVDNVVADDFQNSGIGSHGVANQNCQNGDVHNGIQQRTRLPIATNTIQADNKRCQVFPGTTQGHVVFVRNRFRGTAGVEIKSE
jgi:hypothetical protein